MYILGNLLLFIILVAVLYKIGSIYTSRSDQKRFKAHLRDEINKQNRDQ